MKGMRYTFEQFNTEYPDDDACLQEVFDNRFGDLKVCPNCGVTKAKFYRVKKRKSYACKDCGYHINPLANTIFHKSSTPLKQWFYAIYLFSVSKNGVSAKELVRHVGVSYPTAHRMYKQIRKLMADETGRFEDNDKPKQTDETWVGKFERKKTVLGIVETGGSVKAKVVPRATADNAVPFLLNSVQEGSIVHTDSSKIYQTIKQYYEHKSVRHVSKEYVTKEGVHTNAIEGFWAQLKTSILGTYKNVSPYYLQSYVNEFQFRYNHRNETVFPILISRAVTRVL